MEVTINKETVNARNYIVGIELCQCAQFHARSKILNM